VGEGKRTQVLQVPVNWSLSFANASSACESGNFGSVFFRAQNLSFFVWAFCLPDLLAHCPLQRKNGILDYENGFGPTIFSAWEIFIEILENRPFLKIVARIHNDPSKIWPQS